ncbi:hypothetical protein F5Y05DRAFT_414334 [Hypoxylon sp. FL0543]|nr:hypothetical protein F5Y05DRAFT_414334 [Hypoxylon sp. FL0543]
MPRPRSRSRRAFEHWTDNVSSQPMSLGCPSSKPRKPLVRSFNTPACQQLVQQCLAATRSSVAPASTTLFSTSPRSSITPACEPIDNARCSHVLATTRAPLSRQRS